MVLRAHANEVEGDLNQYVQVLALSFVPRLLMVHLRITSIHLHTHFSETRRPILPFVVFIVKHLKLLILERLKFISHVT